MPDCDSGAETKTVSAENMKLILFLFPLLEALPAIGLQVKFLTWKCSHMCLCLVAASVGSLSDQFCGKDSYSVCGSLVSRLVYQSLQQVWEFTNTHLIDAFFCIISHVNLCFLQLQSLTDTPKETIYCWWVARRATYPWCSYIFYLQVGSFL